MCAIFWYLGLRWYWFCDFKQSWPHHRPFGCKPLWSRWASLKIKPLLEDWSLKIKLNSLLIDWSLVKQSGFQLDKSTPMSAGTVLRCRPLDNTHWEGFIAPEEESFAKRFSSVWQIIFSKCSNMSWVQYWFLSLFSPPSSSSKLSSFSFYDYSFYGHSGQIGIWGTCAGSQLWR